MSSEAVADSTLIREFVSELLNRNAAIFAGAGLSVASGYVDWKGLLKDIFADLQLDPDKESDLVRVAQYHFNQTGSKGRLAKTIFDHFARTTSPTKNHQILANLPIETYWTTNYDKLIETALDHAARPPDVKYTVAQLAHTRIDRAATVYKMHGDVLHPDDAVISRDDYEAYPQKMDDFISALQGDLVSKTFLFLGFSFTDPNLDYVLSRVRFRHEGHQRNHYCIQKKVTQGAEELEVDFTYRQLQQHYFIKDLKRFAIQTVLVDTYEEITALLQRITDTYRRHSVFVSGAAEAYAPWSRDEAEIFLRELSFKLSSSKCRIVTGFGVGVGGSVINGVLDQLNVAHERLSERYIVMRPFPQTASPGLSLAEHWTNYRKAMIGDAGIAVFVFGNKRDGANIVDSNGMREEFDLCLKARVCPLPIGLTGHMAEVLWNDVRGQFDAVYPGASPAFRTKFQALGEPATDRSHIAQLVVELVTELQRGW
jgi:hypothetical protein